MLRLLALPLLTLTFASATTFAQSVGMLAMANPASAHCASTQVTINCHSGSFNGRTRPVVNFV